MAGDALEHLNELRSECADIVFLDPPFNLGKKYGANGQAGDRVCESQYEAYLTQVLLQSCEVLRDGGALYLYHIPKWAIVFSEVLRHRLTFQHWIAVSMKNGFVRGDKLYPAHYALLLFTKGDPNVFDRPKIDPPRCRHCKKYVKDYGGYKRYIEAGVNLSDMWDDMSPVRHKKHKHRSCNELPLELLRRVVSISGRRNGVLVDPFAGSGTSMVAAVEARMRFVAVEKEAQYCKVIADRLNSMR